jgi:small subunit ribosomal protein S16
VAVKIRLKRMGKIHAPYYRIVVADSRKKRDGRVIEEIGKYHPKSDPSFIEVDSERAQYWLGVGAQPTEPVAVLLKLTGDWQQYKGEPAPTEPVRMPAAKRDKTEAFNEALRDAHDEPKTEAVTRRKSRAADAPATDAPATKTAEPAGEVPAPNAVPADEAVPAEVSAGEVDTSVEVSAETVSEPSPDDAPVAEVATEPAAETPPADAAPSADVDDAPAADDESAQG